MGFSLNVTEIEAGLEIRMRYLHHFEAVYCIAGTGSIEDEATGKIRHEIKPVRSMRSNNTTRMF